MKTWRKMTYFWGNGYHVGSSLTNRNASSAMEESYLQAQFTKLKTNFADRGYPVLIGEWAGQPKPALPDLTGLYKDQNFRSVTYYNKFMNTTILSFGFSGTYFSARATPSTQRLVRSRTGTSLIPSLEFPPYPRFQACNSP